jgi:hypothetical protein
VEGVWDICGFVWDNPKTYVLLCLATRRSVTRKKTFEVFAKHPGAQRRGKTLKVFASHANNGSDCAASAIIASCCDLLSGVKCSHTLGTAAGQ